MPIPDTSTVNERARNLKLHIEDKEDQIDAALSDGRDASELQALLADLEDQLKEVEAAQKEMRSRVRSAQKDYQKEQRAAEKQEQYRQQHEQAQ